MAWYLWVCALLAILPGDQVRVKNDHIIWSSNIFSAIFTVKITAITPNSEHSKKPLSKLQKRKSPTTDDEEWELVPPDGGWVSIRLLAQSVNVKPLSTTLLNVVWWTKYFYRGGLYWLARCLWTYWYQERWKVSGCCLWNFWKHSMHHHQRHYGFRRCATFYIARWVSSSKSISPNRIE